MKKILLLLLLLALVGGFVAYKMYNKPHEDMQSAKADVALKASELFAAYEADESAANAKYLDKTVEVSGKVQSTETKDGKTSVTLDAGGMLGGVICNLDELSDHKRTKFEEGEEVAFKCKCTGMLMDVVLVRCIEI